ncbi:hypothetical protein [Azospirillum sp. TSO22-1]|uniref:hypothetical protein n=1 Tax=Azospirillum sp. TSO22-1 TaxID=716789 RepID=UPI001304CC04|nr:hypothetical protein [Azospirillum sp. TSO22-1]
MDTHAETEAVRPITDLMRERDQELERMIARDRRLLAVVLAGLCVAGVTLWLA